MNAVALNFGSMKWLIMFALLGLALGACSDDPEPTTELPRGAPGDVGMSGQRLNKIQSVVQEFIDNGKIQGAVVGVSRRGKVVYFKAQGLFNVKTKAPLQTDGMFIMMSSTKPILGVAAMMMIEQGLFKASDPIEKFIPEFKNAKVAVPDGSKTGYKLVDAKRPITIHDLLTHTSGFAGFSKVKKTDYENETLATLIPKVAKEPLSFQPGTQWVYGNGLDVVARAIEVASGEAFNVFVQKRIFDPLDMKDTYWIVPKDKQKRMLLPGQGTAPNYFGASWGLTSTARDYLHFQQMLVNKGELFGKRILKPESVETMSKSQAGDLYSKSAKGPAGMAFGYTVGITLDPTLAKDGRSAGAFGWGGALGTVTWTEPREKLAAVIMVQQSTNSLATRVAETISGAILGAGGVLKDVGVNKDAGVAKDGDSKKCKEGQEYEGKGGKWICKNGKWVFEATTDSGAGKNG